jgi:hypothetical protein
MAAIDARKIQSFVEGLPSLLHRYKIGKAETAQALNISRQALYKKISNPAGWKIGELMILDDLIKAKENAALLGSNRRLR